MVILDLIVIGLPTHIQDFLNCNIVTSVKLLYGKLKKFESEDKIFDNNRVKIQNFSIQNFKISQDNVNNRRNRIFSNISSDKKFNGPIDKKPCPNCSKRGFQNRFHPESNCWFKDKEPLSIPKLVNNVEIDSPVTSKDELKN